jgi:hypothetical protein
MERRVAWFPAQLIMEWLNRARRASATAARGEGWGAIKPGSHLAGGMRLDDDIDVKFESHTDDPWDTWLRLRYSMADYWSREKLKIDDKVYLATTRPHFGGLQSGLGLIVVMLSCLPIGRFRRGFFVQSVTAATPSASIRTLGVEDVAVGYFLRIRPLPSPRRLLPNERAAKFD